jgi:hypothetical protein
MNSKYYLKEYKTQIKSIKQNEKIIKLIGAEDEER